MTPPARGVNLPAHIALRDDGAFTRHFDEILGSYAADGVTAVRLGFDWVSLQPRSGGLDMARVEWYLDVIDSATRHGIGVWASLLERSVPHWFDDERGFEDPKTAGRHWPRFVEACADVFGDRVTGWFPIDDPIGLAARIRPDDPVPALETGRREDHLRWKTFLRGVRDGTVVIPGRADRELADLAGAIDLVGVKLRTDLGDDPTVTDESLRRWTERVGTLVHRAADEGPDKPVVVTYHASRRGVDETESDRGHFIESFERAVHACVDDGIPVQTTFTTSLL